VRQRHCVRGGAILVSGGEKSAQKVGGGAALAAENVLKIQTYANRACIHSCIPYVP